MNEENLWWLVGEVKHGHRYCRSGVEWRCAFCRTQSITIDAAGSRKASHLRFSRSRKDCRPHGSPNVYRKLLISNALQPDVSRKSPATGQTGGAGVVAFFKIRRVPGPCGHLVFCGSPRPRARGSPARTGSLWLRYARASQKILRMLCYQ